MKYINKNVPVTLGSLITCGDISDGAIIEIYDQNGALKARGSWFQDNILNFTDSWGTASKAGTGRTIRFNVMGKAEK